MKKQNKTKRRLWSLAVISAGIIFLSAVVVQFHEFGNKEQEIQELLEGLWSSQLIPTGVVVTNGDSSSGLRVLAVFEGHPAAVERQNAEFIKTAEGHGAQGTQYVDRETVMERLRQAIEPDDSMANNLTLKVSVAISKGMRPAASR